MNEWLIQTTTRWWIISSFFFLQFHFILLSNPLQPNMESWETWVLKGPHPPFVLMIYCENRMYETRAKPDLGICSLLRFYLIVGQAQANALHTLSIFRGNICSFPYFKKKKNINAYVFLILVFLWLIPSNRVTHTMEHMILYARYVCQHNLWVFLIPSIIIHSVVWFGFLISSLLSFRGLHCHPIVLTYVIWRATSRFLVTTGQHLLHQKVCLLNTAN